MNRKVRLGITVLILVALAAVIAARLLISSSSREEFTLDEYVGKVESGQVASADVYDLDGRVEGELTDGTDYEVFFNSEFGGDLTKTLLNAPNSITVTVDPQTSLTIGEIVLNVLPYVLFVGIFVVLLTQLGGGRFGRMFGLSKTKRRLADKERPDVGFGDVAGLDEAVEELQEIKEFLKSPERFHNVGARIPRGILLFGPPGSGKTLLARAVAGEAGVPFYSLSGSDFVEMFVGVGAARVRDVFKDAKSAAPSIIFLDEIDAVGRQRGTGVGGGHDEREQTLNQLLVEMDGFDNKTDVIVIAATNRPDVLDPALLRPGRFDRRITVDLPDLGGRRKAFDVHMQDKPVSSSVDVGSLSKQTAGFSGADIANVVNEAALLAGRHGHRNIGRDEFSEAIERTLAGPERRSRVLTEAERRVAAVHESGHAVVGHALPNANDVHKVSVVSRGSALGYTLALPDEDRTLFSKSEFEDQIAMLMGGRAAEEAVFGEPSSGAADDLRRATELARHMVCEQGMSDELGPRHFATHGADGEVFLGRSIQASSDLSDDVASAIDAEISSVLADAYTTARAVVEEHRGDIDRMAEQLLEVETLEGNELDKLLSDVPVWQDRKRGHLRRHQPAAPTSPRKDESSAALSDPPKPSPNS